MLKHIMFLGILSVVVLMISDTSKSFGQLPPPFDIMGIPYAESLISEGSSLLGNENFTGAIELFDRALDILPYNVNALTMKGVALSGMDNYTGAIEQYDTALDIDPNYFTALLHKGLALSNTGNYIEAIELYDRALAIQPDRTDIMTLKSTAVTQSNGTESAETIMQNSTSDSNIILD
ncbi:MAG: tetratricopeptide repeat protein [Nitrososphaeraceae archaeon]